MAIIRPSGHHDEPDRAMGFCFFNNISVATSYLLARVSLSLCTMKMEQKNYPYIGKVIAIMLAMDWGLDITLMCLVSLINATVSQ